jgi:hypothetical protein
MIDTNTKIKRSDTSNRATGFGAGIVSGMSSFVQLWGTSRSFLRPSYPSNGIKSDWLSVGGDMRSALSTWKVDETP